MKNPWPSLDLPEDRGRGADGPPEAWRCASAERRGEDPPARGGTSDTRADGALTWRCWLPGCGLGGQEGGRLWWALPASRQLSRLRTTKRTPRAALATATVKYTRIFLHKKSLFQSLSHLKNHPLLTSLLFALPAPSLPRHASTASSFASFLLSVNTLTHVSNTNTDNTPWLTRRSQSSPSLQLCPQSVAQAK